MSTVPQAGGAPVDGVPPLLARILDDAALVSPGPRPEMSDVLDAYLDVRAGEYGGLLGTLVVPVSRLQEFVAVLLKRRPASPVPITLSVDTGLGGVPKALSLTTSRSALLTTGTVEMPAPHDVDSVWLEREIRVATVERLIKRREALLAKIVDRRDQKNLDEMAQRASSARAHSGMS